MEPGTTRATGNSPKDGSGTEGDGQYLSFILGDEGYAVDILKVREIMGWEEVRPLPDTPDYVKGVLDLRGAIVPILDLRLRFGLKNAEYTATTVIIVLTVNVDDEQYIVGVVVDNVSDVLNVAAGDVRASPSLGKKISTKYILGMVTLDQRVVVLLDVDNLLDPDELTCLKQ